MMQRRELTGSMLQTITGTSRGTRSARSGKPRKPLSRLRVGWFDRAHALERALRFALFTGSCASQAVVEPEPRVAGARNNGTSDRFLCARIIAAPVGDHRKTIQHI